MTLAEALIVMFVLLVLVAMILPAFSRVHRRRGPGCINQLKQVGIAYKVWASDMDNRYPMQVPVANGGSMGLLPGTNTFFNYLVMSNELTTPKILLCGAESDRWRKMASRFENPLPAGAANETPFASNTNLSYFVGMDAKPDEGSMFLAGDHNVTNGFRIRNGLLVLVTNKPSGWTAEVHKSQGNILFVDGHVETLPRVGLHEVIGLTGITTNRLAMP